MKAYVVFAVGIMLRVVALIAAALTTRFRKQPLLSGIWFRTYVILLVASLMVSVALMNASFFERHVSIDAYRFLFDLLALVLAGTLISGLILVLRNRRYLASYTLFVFGAIATFGELFGR